MPQSFDIAIIGGDMRQSYLADILLDRGYSVTCYCLCESKKNIPLKPSLKEAVVNSRIIIGPTPFSRDNVNIYEEFNTSDMSFKNLLSTLTTNNILLGGNISDKISDFCFARKIPYYDFMKIKEISILNSISTAEGTILEAIKNSTGNLHQSNSIILGYGKCAKILASKLQGLNVNVTIAARNPDDCFLANAYGYSSVLISMLKSTLNDFDYIFNTIPAMILDYSLLKCVRPSCTIIDIASSPGGLDYKAANDLNLNASLCLGLPGKYAPKASAKILADALINLLEKEVIL